MVWRRLQAERARRRPYQPRFDHHGVLASWLGGLLAITSLGLISNWSHDPLVVAPFGASTVLLFGHPGSPLAQPRNIVIGNSLAALALRRSCWTPQRCLPLADSPYLIALALLEQQGERAMPLQGRSLPEAIGPDGDPGAVGERLAYELLLRCWQRSDQGPLQRALNGHSLLLVQVPIEALQDSLPRLKADWIRSGNGAALLEGLAAIASGLWSLELPNREQPRYGRL